jgi:hypothetical protein
MKILYYPLSYLHRGCFMIALLFLFGSLVNRVSGQAAGVLESCNTTSVTYRADRNNSDVFWYDAQTGGNVVGSGLTFTTSNLTQRYFWVSYQTQGQRLEANLLRFQKPEAAFTVPQLNCVNTPMTFKATGTCQGSTFISRPSSGVYSPIGTFPMTNQDLLTMQAWVKWDGIITGGASQCIMLNGNSGSSGYALYIDGASKNLSILLGGVALLKSGKTLTANQWQHVAIVRNQGRWTLYVDGLEYSVSNDTATPYKPGANGGGRFSIGKNDSQTDGFTGEIDEVAIWKRAFNLKEVNELRTGVCVTKYGSDGNWNFNETSGTAYNDVSGYGFNLTTSDPNARGIGATYQWDFGDGSGVVITNELNVSHEFSSRGRKTVTLTVSDLTNCSNSTSQVVSFASAPAGVTATASAPASVCIGESIDVTSSAIPYMVETNFPDNFNGWTLGPEWIQEPRAFSVNLPSVNKALIIYPRAQKIISSALMPPFSTVGRKDIFIFVSHFFSNFNKTIGTIEASTDGTNWSILSTHAEPYPEEIKFKTERIPLPIEMENQQNVYLRFRYNDTEGNTLFNAWYIESIKVGLTTYSWTTIPEGITSDEKDILGIFPQITTTYSLLTTNGCDTKRSNVTVVAKPYPAATISGGGNICLNSKKERVYFKGSGATGPYTFTYAVLNDRGDRSERTVTTTSGDTVSVLVDASVIGKVYYDLISVTTPTSCVTTLKKVQTVTFNVLGFPRALINGKDQICPGENEYIDIWGENGDGPFAFRYKSPDNEIFDVRGTVEDWTVHLKINTSRVGSQVFKILSVSSPNGCSYSYPSGTEPTETVTVKPAPVANITQSGNTYCYDPVVLTASGSGNYTWTGEGLNKTTGEFVEARPETKTVYKVTSNLDGCLTTATATVDVSKITLTGLPSASNYLVCPGTAVTLTAPKATVRLAPFYQENFDTDPFQRNWTKTRTLSGEVAFIEEWRLMEDETSFWQDVLPPVNVGSRFVSALWAPSRAGGVITHRLTSPAFTTLNKSNMTLTLNDFVTIIKSPKSAANVQLSLDGQNWTTISSITDQRIRLVSPTTRHIAIPAQFENKGQVWIRFEAIFENINGSFDEQFQWWGINNISIAVTQDGRWAWRKDFTNVEQTENPLIINPVVPTGYQAIIKADYGCSYGYFLPLINTSPVPVLTLGRVESIPINKDYANVPITGYSGFDRLSVLSSGAHPMPGYVTRNYENLTSMPSALPVYVPVVPAGTYDFVMHATNSTTGCSTDVPFQVTVGSSDSRISGLTVDVAPSGWEGEMITVSAAVKAVVITATVSDPLATLTINGLAATSGVPARVPLTSTGTIQIPVTVTAQDHTQNTVMITIFRQNNIDKITIQTNAKVSYSLRKLSNSYLHSAITTPAEVPGFNHADKPLVRVRRSADNALLDLGYDGTGAMDTLTLLRFAGTGDAFVSVWYDQSSNDLDAFQTTFASQPRVVHNGIIERKNSVPTVYFNGSGSQNIFLNTASFQGFDDQFSLFAVAGVKENQESNQNGLASKMSGGYPAPFSISGSSFSTGNGTQDVATKTLIAPFASATPFGSWWLQRQPVPSTVFALLNIASNIWDQSVTGPYADGGSPLVIGSDQQGQSRLNGWISELILSNEAGLYPEISDNQMQVYLRPQIISFATSGSTQLIIQGNNFTGATSVTIGGAGLGFQVVNDNKIIATVTALSSGMVSITTPSGTGSKGFFYGPPPGNALHFGGGLANLQFDNLLTRPDFTIEMWIHTSVNSAIGSVPDQGTILVNANSGGVANGFVLSILNNKIAFLDGDGNKNAFGTTNVVDGRWHHVAVVRKPAASNKIYIDGVADGEGLAGITSLTASPIIYVGGSPANGNLAFQGEMDELRIWQVVLNDDQLIAGMQNVPLKPYNTELKNYYAFDVFKDDPTTEVYNLASPDRPGTLDYFGGDRWIESYAMVVPKVLEGKDITSKGFTANWAAPSVGSVQSYVLEISKNPAFTRNVDGYMEIQLPPVLKRSVTNLDPVTKYYYRISARRSNDDNNGGWSRTMPVTTLHNLDLTNLSLSQGSLNETFNSDLLNYTSHVDPDVANTQVTAFIMDARAQMQIRLNDDTWTDLASGAASAPLALAAGPNVVTIKITIADQPDPQIYTINIFKDFAPPGNALSFNAVNHHATLDNSGIGNFGTGAFTIELYMRTTQLTSGSIFNKRDVCNLTSYLDFIVADGKMKFVSCTDASGKDYKSLVGNAFVSDGRWHHVAVTRQGATITLYVDDKQDVTFTGTGIADISNTVPVKIGINVCENRFVGSMDELRVWDVAKSQSELESLSWFPAPTPAAHLIVYYNFDTGINDPQKTLVNLAGFTNSANLQNGGPTRWAESYAMVRPRVTDASDVAQTGFTANWTSSPIGYAEQYVLQVSTSPAFDSFVDGYNGLAVSGKTWQQVTIPSASNGRTAAASTYYYRVAASKAGLEGQGAFSETVSVPMRPLPVNLLSFTGKRVENASLLKWRVIDEVQFARYEIERSFTGKHFDKIGEISALFNEQKTEAEYQFTDRIPSAGFSADKLYYRLKMVDQDGSFSYSRMLWLSVGPSGEINLYPNPATNQITVILSEILINSEAQLYDQKGRLLRTVKIASTKTDIDVKAFSTGIYFIRFEDGKVMKFVKD